VSPGSEPTVSRTKSRTLRASSGLERRKRGGKFWREKSEFFFGFFFLRRQSQRCFIKSFFFSLPLPLSKDVLQQQAVVLAHARAVVGVRCHLEQVDGLHEAAVGDVDLVFF